ncbi:IS1634 family transposase [Pseudonocardia sp.]|uniref:IS1634 family transposase n=1 Tax=Pseudonocardia sp. TaxID=60912 RepID=UPI003D0EC958
MAFIRRVRTGSGATVVQIAEYVSGRKQRIVAHLGSAHTEAELGLLMARARGMLDDAAQGELDLGLAKVERRHRLAASPQDPALFDSTSTAAGPARGRGSVDTAEPARVVSTSSVLLFDLLAGVYDALGFSALGDEVFRDLVIARVVEPTALHDAGRVLADFGRGAASYSTMRRTLRRAAQTTTTEPGAGSCGASCAASGKASSAAAGAGSYRDWIADLCFAHALSCGDVSLVLYDVTTLYFEADKEDGLRKVGFSKERRVDPQIVVGLLVDRHGFPLEIGCFEGNKAEKLTIVPIIEQFHTRHRIENMIIVADAGMLSAANLTTLDEAGFTFIVGSRQSKAPIDLESHFGWHGDGFTDGQVIDTITPKRGANTANNTKLRAEPVWDPTAHPGSWRAVWTYSAKRFARDNRTLNAQEVRARAVVNGEACARTPRFVKTTGDGQTLDEKALARARRLAGLKGYVTNLPATIMDAAAVIEAYHDLWHVEASFRMSKTDLAARPMFHRTRDSIEAHLTIVFTALAVARTAQTRTGLSIRKIVRSLRPLRSATIAINGAEQTFPPQIPAELEPIVAALRD